MSEKPIVGITMGDPAGNGPEITVKALSHADIYDRCRPIVVGDAKMLEQATHFVGRPDIAIHRCEKVSDAKFTPGTIDVLHLELIPDVKTFPIGQVSVEGGKAAGVSFVKCLKVKDENGRFAPVYDENTVQVTPCETVLYCIGQKAEWKTLLAGTQVEFNPNGTAKADPVTYQTAEPDIFVGGDAYTGQKFAIDAIAAGKQGAISLHRYVQGATLTIGRDRRQFIELDKKNALIAVDSYDNTPRQHIGYNDALRKTFRDERVAFTAEQVKAETARCLGCGASIVDPNKCIGCGVCTTKCAFDAIHLHRERPECSTMYACEDKMKAILPYMIKRNIKIKKAERRAKKAAK